jgi:hypothetical protein
MRSVVSILAPGRPGSWGATLISGVAPNLVSSSSGRILARGQQ